MVKKKLEKSEKMLGSKVKKVTKSEKKNLVFARKYLLLLKKTIKKARCLFSLKIFRMQNITVKRPGSGMSPYLWNKIIGKKAKKKIFLT